MTAMHQSGIPLVPAHHRNDPRRRFSRARIATVGVILCLAVIVASCAGSSKKRLSEPSQLAVRINTVITELEERINARDQEGIIALLTPSLAGDADLRRGIKELLSLPGLNVTFMVERMWRTDDNTMRVDLQWTLRAKPPSGSTISTGRGRFLLVGSDQHRLDQISGENPFSNPASNLLTP